MTLEISVMKKVSIPAPNTNNENTSIKIFPFNFTFLSYALTYPVANMKPVISKTD
jgi:hypothetical protein